MNDIPRARLLQERWFALVRLLLVEALLFQTQLAPISSPLLGTLQSLILVVFGIFTLVIIFMKS